MKYSEPIISDMLRQNKFLLIILFSLALFINCSEKKSAECNKDLPLSFINIHSDKPIESIKVYQYKSNIVKDSMIFLADEKRKGYYIFNKECSNYSLELKKTYIFQDRFKVVIDQKTYILKDFKLTTSKKATNYQHENLCELKEYVLNGQLIKNNAVIIDEH